EDLGLVFDEFRRSGDARAGKVKGTGLGLPISRRLARMHGGELCCESALGEGSTFILQIPCRPSAALLAQHGREALEAA
ncbi:MAG: PAS domain-containing sensor histidine kinase, partial [Candidatus Methylomirabilis sp.]|nr:PAS domain-containing sensor histidine kinase [Deltaproteobacteria bacterium]